MQTNDGMGDYLDSIPPDLVGTLALPEGVSEAVFATLAEIQAFLTGLNWVGDIDVSSGTPFRRGDDWVVRVGTGCYVDDFDEEDE